ncbi:hypothetical protein ACFRCI_34815 [Streptomyces sp. NPDC056638]|uniref:hypothetical protein n=1 Tax=Streptomyces sp. NPDC056638 TaxID=3345887 RepID=UPI0036BDF9A0
MSRKRSWTTCASHGTWSLGEALAISEELGSPFRCAQATMHLAEATSALGTHAEALGLALASVELCTQTQDRGGRMTALVILGDARLAEEAPGCSGRHLLPRCFGCNRPRAFDGPPAYGRGRRRFYRSGVPRGTAPGAGA